MAVCVWPLQASPPQHPLRRVEDSTQTPLPCQLPQTIPRGRDTAVGIMRKEEKTDTAVDKTNGLGIIKTIHQFFLSHPGMSRSQFVALPDEANFESSSMSGQSSHLIWYVCVVLRSSHDCDLALLP